MATSAVCTDNELFENSDRITKLLTDLNRTLLTEIAHQSLPPSGIPLPIPKLIHGKTWQMSCSSESLLPIEVSLNEYEQTFSYLRWYQYEEQFVILNSSYALHEELKNIVANL
ncbi:hypothetical protein ACS0PU_001284 [Formica fusca]